MYGGACFQLDWALNLDGATLAGNCNKLVTLHRLFWRSWYSARGVLGVTIAQAIGFRSPEFTSLFARWVSFCELEWCAKLSPSNLSPAQRKNVHMHESAVLTNQRLCRLLVNGLSVLVVGGWRTDYRPVRTPLGNFISIQYAIALTYCKTFTSTSFSIVWDRLIERPSRVQDYMLG